MKREDLKNKHVLITGAGGGIGYYAAREFARCGSVLHLADISETALEKSRRQLADYGVTVYTYVYDVSDLAAVNRMARDVSERCPGLDILINNAGLGHHDEIAATSPEEWRRQIDINLLGPIYHVHALLPAMRSRKDGLKQIVNVSSGQYYFQLPTWGIYTAVKAALAVFSETLHHELKPDGFRVTTVYPFMVNTGFYNDVESESAGSRLSMSLLPLYSETPQVVGSRLFQAVLKKKKSENVNILNELARVGLNFAPAATIFRDFTYRLLGHPRPGQSEGPLDTGLTALADVVDDIRAGIAGVHEQAPGFLMTEVMTGQHEFQPGFGSPGEKFMEFSVDWGPSNILDWANPTDGKFMLNDLSGNVTIEGLGANIPCEGRLELRYFDENKIRYVFHFEHDSENYRFVGEKKNIQLWNLPDSHTRCYGKLFNGRDELISLSETRFEFPTSVDFIKSFRLVFPGDHRQGGQAPAPNSAQKTARSEKTRVG